MTTMPVCEHCGRTELEPITLRVKGGHVRRFCSVECALSSVAGRRAVRFRAIVEQRGAIIRELEAKRGSKIIALIHRVELRQGKDQHITIDDSEDILHQIRSTPRETPIDLIIHCPGGVVLPAEQIALALDEHEGKVSAIVPHYAMSGATLICLAADEIIMDPYSVLGPLDPQIAGFPAPSLLRLLELKPPQFISDQMLILADLASKSLKQMKAFIISIVGARMKNEKAEKLAEFLTGGYLTHDTPITAGLAQSLGLPVRVGIPDEVHRFMRLHKLTSNTHSTYYTKFHNSRCPPATLVPDLAAAPLFSHRAFEH